jgi:predicted dehydrogenase
MSIVTKDLVRFAVVGAGHMGANHIKKIMSMGPKIGAKVSVIVEPDELRAQMILRDFGPTNKPKVVSNIGELSQLGRDDFPDAAIVAVPASIHVEAAAACLTKGLHCLVEKPLGFSALDVKDLERQAVTSNKLLQVGLLERWTMANLWGGWKPKSGPWTLQAVRSGPFVPRAADTNVVHDLMIHDLDLYVLLESAFQLPRIKEIKAWGRSLRSSLLDLALVHFELEDGGYARFFASRLSAEGSRSWEMTGPNWHATIDFMRRTLKRFERVGREATAFEAKESQWTSGDPLGLEIEAFVARIRGAKPVIASPSFCTFDQLVPTPVNVLRTHELIDEVLSCIRVVDG